MAKKKKTSSNNARHDSRLNQALKSLYPSGTQISSILPVQDKFSTELPGTSNVRRTKGTKSVSRTGVPQKLLLQLTNPGKEPTAPVEPKAVKNPYSVVDRAISRLTEELDIAKGKGDKDTAEKINANIKEATEQRAIISGTIAGKSYDSFLASHASWLKDIGIYKNSTLPNYRLAVEQFQSGQRTNKSNTDQYNKDITNFFSGKRTGSTGTKARASTRKGSRGKGASGTAKRMGTR
jgi:hypothetical protein